MNSTKFKVILIVTSIFLICISTFWRESETVAMQVTRKSLERVPHPTSTQLSMQESLWEITWNVLPVHFYLLL